MTHSASAETSATAALADHAWQHAVSERDAVQLWPERIDLLLNALDLEYPGLEQVKNAAQAGSVEDACRALVSYYKSSPNGEPYRKTAGRFNLKAADSCVNDILPASGLWAKTPRLSHGGLDWSYQGPPGYDNNQWHQINRH